MNHIDATHELLMPTVEHASPGQAIEQWLSEQVEPAFQALRDNPESGLTAEQLLANLAARRKKGREQSRP